MDDVILVDNNDKELGVVSRKKAHVEGLLHRIVVIYLTNDKEQILLQERLDYKRSDHSSAGHVDPGETYLEAAKRELKEELGVECELSEIGEGISEEYKIYGDSYIKHIFKIYECQAEPVEIAKDEVSSVKWAGPMEVWEDMKNDPKHEKYTGGFKASLEIYLKAKNYLKE